jgi:GNAT superfamily N-acetyltransferase
LNLVRISLKKIRRQRNPGELAVEQTRDIKLVATMLAAADLTAAGLDWPSACYLAAYVGEEPVGVVGVETNVDIALIRSLLVIEPMRSRGIGAALIQAARTAAHTRGARRLFAITRGDAHSYFERFGFAPIDVDEALDALVGTFVRDYVRADANRLVNLVAIALDISRDGVIVR